MATNNVKLINALVSAFGQWRDSGKMTEITQDAAIDSIVGVLQAHKLDALAAHWQAYKSLAYSQAEYRLKWSPYNGSSKASELNTLPPQMSLKNARRMDNLALQMQLEQVFDEGKGWGRLNRETSFTGYRTDARLSDEINKERAALATSNKDKWAAKLQEDLAKDEAKKAARAASRKGKGKTEAPVVIEVNEEGLGEI